MCCYLTPNRRGLIKLERGRFTACTNAAEFVIHDMSNPDPYDRMSEGCSLHVGALCGDEGNEVFPFLAASPPPGSDLAARLGLVPETAGRARSVVVPGPYRPPVEATGADAEVVEMEALRNEFYTAHGYCGGDEAEYAFAYLAGERVGVAAMIERSLAGEPLPPELAKVVVATVQVAVEQARAAERLAIDHDR